MIALNDSQRKAVEKLEKLRVGALFMEPGTGKTRVALNLINSSKTDFVLFMCPFQTKDNLAKEIAKWGIKVSYRIEGIESLSNSDNLYVELVAEIRNHKEPFLVVDESLKIKNISAVRAQRIIELGKMAGYRLILNGTPLSRNVLDIWSQMEFLSHKILNMGYWEFMNNFVEYIKFTDGNSSHTYIKSYANLDYLYSLIQPYVVDANLDLNVKSQEIEIEYALGFENYQTYQNIKARYMNQLMDMTSNPNIFMAMLSELQQSYCNCDSKIKITSKLVKELGNDETVIFCKFLRSRDSLLAANKSWHVLTYGKGSLGLNLQRYKHIIFFDKTFDYAQLIQAKRRIYRMGQNSDVTFHFLTGDVGLEKMIDHNIDNKSDLLTHFKKAVVAGEERRLLDEL